MRAIVAAVLLIGVGTGCCKTCGWCHDDAPPRTGSGYPNGQPPLESPPVSGAVPGNPPAPAGTPVSRPVNTGAYGGTGN
jgi:hypothetical protein